MISIDGKTHDRSGIYKCTYSPIEYGKLRRNNFRNKRYFRRTKKFRTVIVCNSDIRIRKIDKIKPEIIADPQCGFMSEFILIYCSIGVRNRHSVIIYVKFRICKNCGRYQYRYTAYDNPFFFITIFYSVFYKRSKCFFLLFETAIRMLMIVNNQLCIERNANRFITIITIRML